MDSAGLRDGQQIPQILVDPKNPERVFVAVLGHPYGPNEERGIFRSTDGGRTFRKVLYRDENTGGIDLAFDPVDTNTIYAALWEARQGPWENAAWTGPGSGLHKSIDGGETWKPLTQGLPSFAEGLSRIGITVAPSDRNRLYAVVDAGTRGGIYRSDNGGEAWTRVNATRASSPGRTTPPTSACIPRIPTSSTCRRSSRGSPLTAAGRLWRGAARQVAMTTRRSGSTLRGPDTMIMTADQGAVVTVNGGETWSSWYNQPTAQFYHVSADNAFPYRVCGGQQESGSACGLEPWDDGQITIREWHPVAARVRLRRRGSKRSGHRLRRQVSPLRPSHGSGADSVPPRATPQLPRVAHRACVFLPTSAHAVSFATNVLWKTTTADRRGRKSVPI
jgi:hypothetical protein